LPKFKYDYAASMNETLRKLGIPDAFSQDKADFSKLGTSPAGNIFIGDVLHKAYISVDELGTKAGAATKVEMLAGSAPNFITVKLDRPFVYAIIDDETKLPIFIGVMMGV
jgi:serine protease inhibitor